MRKFSLSKGLLTAFTLFSGVSLFGQGVCTQFSYYYADINYPSSGAETDFYSVALDGDNAILTPILEDVPETHHIAYNEESQLLFTVQTSNGDIRTLDPITGVLSAPVSVTPSVSGVTVTAFNSEGQLLIGASNGVLYSVDLGTNPYELSEYSDGNDISGGDIAFAGEGASESLYLSSKPLGKFYEVIPGFANNMFTGNVDGEVTGMATLADGEGVIVSSRGNNQFLTYSIDGNEISESGAYNAILGDQPFDLENGDMASGCSESSSSIEGCEDFRTYYMEDAQGGGMDNLYEVSFNDMGGVMLNNIGTFGSSSHLGVGPNGLLYIVRAGTGMMTVYDPILQDEQYSVQITFDGNNVTNVPAVAVGDDGFVYVGSSATDMVYRVDPISGISTEFGAGNVGGGDLVFVGDQLWLANRGLGRFFEINGPGEFDVDAEEINGVSILPDGNLLIANGNLNGLFEVYVPGTGEATGETFETGLVLYNGDLGSRCFDGNNIEVCEDYQMFLSANGSEGGDLYSFSIDDEGDVILNLLRADLGQIHLAFDESNGLLYLVKGNTGEVAIFDPSINLLSDFVNIADGDLDLFNTFSAVVIDSGELLVGSGPLGSIYSVDPATGAASFYAQAPVSGGDLVQTNDGNLWVVNRSAGGFYNVSDNGASVFPVELEGMYGALIMADGGILVGSAGNQLSVVDPNAPDGLSGTAYTLPFSFNFGDLASGCSDNNPIITPGPGECYASEMIEYVQGTNSNGGNIAANRTDASNALGMPEQVDQLVFVTLGYGGSITLGFDGLVPNGDGDDLIFIETSYNNPGCENYPEYADIYVSPNGVDFFFAETVCKGDNGVDISAAGDFDNILLVKAVHNDALTSTPDAYDLDGVIAIYNCEGDDDNGGDTPPVTEEVEVAALSAEPTDLISYPNPTEGATVIEFSVVENKRAVVEVFDMNGRSVATVFNQDVQEGNTYRVDFDGTSLVNGIYVIKYVTDTETIIEKLMIAK